MTQEVSKEDQDWLDALAGKPTEGIDPIIAAQALAVRGSLATRRAAIESDAIQVGDSGLNEIRARLQREGLMDSSGRNQQKNVWWTRALDIIGFGVNGGSAKLASFLEKFLFGGPQSDESLVYRGDPNTTTLIVENPEVRANEIVAGVKAVTADGIEMTRLKDGRIQLQIKDSENVRDYLLTQRIEATVVNGIIKIDVVPMKK